MSEIIKRIIKSSAFISLSAIIITASLSWALDIAFTDYFIRDLKATEANVEAETVTIKSPDGEIITLVVGDVIGRESFTITAIGKSAAELQSPPDNRGRTHKSHIFINKIHTLEDCTFIEPKKLKPPSKK